MIRKFLLPAVIVLLLVFVPLVFARSAQAEPSEATGATGGGSEPKVPLDPVVGNWGCSNGVYNWAIFFHANGTLIQQEPTFGNTRDTSWTRLSDQEITLGGGQVLSVTMDGNSRMSVLDTRVGSTWDCTRK
jgi:hypothetical protein